MAEWRFRLPANNTDHPPAELTNAIPFAPHSATKQTIIFYDTFDWRLFTQSLSLLANEDHLQLRSLEEQTTRATAVVLPTHDHPYFIWDLPAGNLRSQVEPHLGLRALLPLATCQVIAESHRVLNEDKKTIAHLSYEHWHIAKTNIPFRTIATLRSVRGYEKESRILARQLLKYSYVLATGDDLFTEVMTAANKQPGAYNSKPQISLDPTMRADKATKKLLLALLHVINANAPHIAQDIDTEFLHDFRVAIRRTRSLLTQMKGVFPARTVAYFKENLRTIGQSTNKLRDLDVYLLQMAAYRARLPESLRDDLTLLSTYLQEQRDQSLAEVSTNLRSAHYHNILQDWETFLREPEGTSETAVNGADPILQVSKARIYKHYRRIVKKGPAMVASHQAADLHALRIECKKMRYLLEFYDSLFPPEKIATLITQLKQLQNNLGHLNDLRIQEQYLLNLTKEMSMRKKRARHALLAIGGLITLFHEDRQQQETELAQTFATFISPETQAIFRAIFK